jgi:Gpi18-like mannosyltransferase
MEDHTITRSRIEILLLFALYVLLLPRVYMEYDMGFWRDWAVQIHRYGIGNCYDHGLNYFPVFVYALYFYDLLQGTEANIIANINNIKILFVCFDFLPLIVLCCFRQKLLQFKIPYLFLLLNIAYVFNSMVWGQIDSIYANLSFLAILVAIFYPVGGSLLYLMALNTKPQAIEFLPVIGIMLLYSVRNWKTLFYIVLAVAGLQLLLFIPWLGNNGIGKLFSFASHAVDLYNRLSICAFNIWYIIVPHNQYFINDKDTFILISYKATGLIMFSAAAAYIVWPLLKSMWQLRKNKLLPAAINYEYILLGTGLLCLYFFYFNTQMHERYANPIIIFFFFYGVVSRNYKLYILASIPYFLSLDKCFPNYLPVHHYKIIWADKVIALWYTATVIYGSWLWWRLIHRKVALA